jgi:hypothetical protein
MTNLLRAARTNVRAQSIQMFPAADLILTVAILSQCKKFEMLIRTIRTPNVQTLSSPLQE